LDNAEQYCFALLVNGGNYVSEGQFCSFLNGRSPAESAFYAAQPRICEILIRGAYKSCTQWKAKTTDGSAISFDGSWSQRRNALHCFGTFLDPRQGKVVDFDALEDVSCGGEYRGTSQAMESEVLRTIAKRRIDETRETAHDPVAVFCHDQDNHAMKILREELHWDLTERFDRNHVLKIWAKRFEAFNWIEPVRTDQAKKPRRVNALGKLKPRLLRWLHLILKSDGTIEAKRARWLGAFAPYVHPTPDQAFLWSKNEEEKAQTQLRVFLEGTASLIELVQTEFSTQLNESLDAIKAKLADKTTPGKDRGKHDPQWESSSSTKAMNGNFAFMTRSDFRRERNGTVRHRE
jgi:hypothetical protein